MSGRTIQLVVVGAMLAGSLISQTHAAEVHKDYRFNVGPKAGVSVVWETSGGPTADLGPPTLTGSDGIAQTFWKMPQAEGPTFATAAVAGASGSPVTFQASAFGDLPTRILIESGDGQSQSSGMVFANLLAVRVTDHFLNRRPHVTVQWLVASGSVALDAYSSATGADGIATLAVTAGATPGPATITAALPGGPPLVTFNVTVVSP